MFSVITITPGIKVTVPNVCEFTTPTTIDIFNDEFYENIIEALRIYGVTDYTVVGYVLTPIPPPEEPYWINRVEEGIPDGVATLGEDGKLEPGQAPPGISGGTSGYVSKFTSATTIADSIITDDGTNVDVGGNLTGLIPPISFSSSQLLTSSQVKGQIYYIDATAVVTITLPPVVVGGNLVIYSVNAFVVNVDPDNNDRIILDGAAGGFGKMITSPGAAGDLVSLHGDSLLGWTIIGKSGTWTMEA